MTLDGTRLLELHSSVYVASGMSHREWNQAAVSYSTYCVCIKSEKYRAKY